MKRDNALWRHSVRHHDHDRDIGNVAVELQGALWRAGLGWAVGVVDLLHATTAVANDAVVLHYDSDFDDLAEVDRRVRARWIVAPGSVA